jgi:chromate transporter
MTKPSPTGTAGASPLISDDALHHARPTLRRAATILLVGLPLWLAPVGLAAGLTGTSSVFTQQGLFFSGAALVTFGGARRAGVRRTKGGGDLRMADGQRNGSRSRAG